MSLDVHLYAEDVQNLPEGEVLIVWVDGCPEEWTLDKWYAEHPDIDPIMTKFEGSRRCVYYNNITHNLTKMANYVGLYKPLWTPDEIGVTKASQLVPLLIEGINKLIVEYTNASKLVAENGWGTYDGLLGFAKGYLEACKEYPDADVEVSR